MDKSALFDAALEKLMGDMDDMEGKAAMSHSADECPDPLGCTMHDMDHSESLTSKDGEPAAVKIEVHKLGMPSLDGVKEGDKEDLSPEEAEVLKKILK